jgi:outer membrane protein insertion porin family
VTTPRSTGRHRVHGRCEPARAARLLCAALCTSLLYTGAGAQSGPRVREIRFDGNATFDSEVLLKQMYMYPTSWFDETIMNDDPFLFSEDVLQEDLHDLKTFYQHEGFLETTLTPSHIDIDRDGNTVRVTIHVEEGPPVNVDTVLVELRNTHGAGADSLMRTIVPELALQPGMRFRDEALQADQATIIGAFADNAHPYVTAEDSLEVSLQEHRVTIRWSVDPGPAACFGQVRFQGNERFSEKMLSERIEIEPGASFRESALRRSEGELYALTLFRTVSGKPLYESAHGDSIPVEFSVQEASPFRGHFSVGYGREERFRFGINLTWRGVLRSTSRLEIDLKRSQLEPYSITGRFVKPDFLFRRLTFVAYPFIRRENEPSYEADRRGIRLSLEHPLIGPLDGVFSYTIEDVGLDTAAVSVVTREQDIRDAYTKSGFTLGFLYNTSRPPFNPDRGTNITFYYTISGRGFDSPYQFNRLLLDVRRYEGLTETLVLAWRVKAGLLISQETDQFVPVEERFYSGGSTSVRGWSRFELGPKDASGVPIGGNSLLEGSLELRFPIWNILSGVAFFDFGNVWMPSLTYKLDELRFAAGVGLRVGTPVGPIRLDYARQLGSGEGLTQLFFSFGHAF